MNMLPLLLFGGLFGTLVWMKSRRAAASSKATTPSGIIYAYQVRGDPNILEPPYYGFYARTDPGGVMTEPQRTPNPRTDPKQAETDVILIIKGLGGVPKKIPGGVT